MSTLQQIRSGLNEAWDALADGWQRLYRRAAGAITRFTPGSRAGRGGEMVPHGSGWGVLAAEVYDNDDSIAVRLEVPGMNREDFELQVLENILVVRGEKQARRERTEGQYRISECAYGRFERAIPLPAAVDAGKAKASASYRRGVLHVELPRLAVHPHGRVRVKVK